MRNRGHSLFPIIVLTLLGGVSVWLDRVTRQEETIKVDKTRHEPDFTADQLVLRRFDLAGKAQYVLVADRMVHYSDDESTDLIRPRLDYLNRPEPVRMESDFATVSKDGEIVVLTNNVLLKRAAQPGKPEATLRTERMTVWPDDEKMYSDTPVTLTQGSTVVTADRMEGDNIVGDIQLQGRVRGILYRNTPAQKP